MKSLNWIGRCSLAGLALMATPAWGKVTFIGNDLETGAKWRDASVAKANDIDSDNVYGSKGYYLASGKREGYKSPFLTADNVITTNPDGISTLPAFILSLEYTDPAERGRSWGGSGGNFGTLDKVADSTGLTGAAVLLIVAGPNPMSLTLKRTNSPAFRLTLILGNNPNESGFDDPSGQAITVDDGTGAVTQTSGDPNLIRTTGYTTYSTWEISAGSSDITLNFQAFQEGFGIARLSGFGIDVDEIVPATILAQPAGGSFLVNSPLTLSVTAGGSKPTFQWFKNGTAIVGATSKNLVFAQLAASDAGSYHVVVSNATGSATSDDAVLTVSAALPPRLVNYQTAVKKETSLVSLYSFDTLDAKDSQGAHPGTLQGNTRFTEGLGGDPGKALLLGGSGWVNLGQVDAFDFTSGTGSVEAWVRADWTTIGYAPTLFADRDGGVNWSIHMAATKKQIAHWNGSQAVYLDIPDASTNWHYFVATFGLAEDGVSTKWSVFWDGQLAGSISQAFGTAPEATTQLGSSSPAGAEQWVGALDEIAFYSGTLTADAIGKHYAAYAAGDPPVVTTQPVGGAFLSGIPLNLSVAARGADLTYQWFKDNQAIGGATSNTLGFAQLAVSDAGSYHVVVSNAAGAVTSEDAVLTVSASLPQRLVNYQTAVKTETSLISLYSFDALDAKDAKGAHPGTLQGNTGFTEGIGGGPGKALLLGGSGHVNLDQVDAFDFTGGVGSVEAWVRADWVTSPGYNPTIFADRSDPSVNWSIHMMLAKNQIADWNGSQAPTINISDASTNWHHLVVTFGLAEDGFSTQWSLYWDGQLAGSIVHGFGAAPEAPTQLGSSSPAGQERWVGALDEVAFYSDTLTADAIGKHYAAFAAGDPPVITGQPQSGAYFSGSPGSLSVTVQGVNLAYQWFKNGTAIAGATSSTFTIAALAASDSGTYRVKVSNPVGAVDSADATIRVVVPDPAQYRSVVQKEANLVSYYTFESGAVTDLKSAHDGTLDGDATVDAGLGAANKALLLTGLGFSALGEVEAFDFASGNGTIEAWIRADWSASPGYNPTIVADREAGPTYYSLHMMAPKNQIAYWNGSAVALVNIPNAGTNWHHFASTFATNVWSVYWDGELAGTQNEAFGSAPESPTQLGSASSTGQEQWVGALDDVAFYSVTLSPEAIRSHYQAMTGVVAPAPTLQVARTGATLTLTWPAATGFILESADQLPAATWTAVTGVTGNSATVEFSGGARFYRLKKP